MRRDPISWPALLREVRADWRRHPVSRMAAAIAFFTLCSLPGVLTVVIGVADVVFGQTAAARERVLSEVTRTMGPDAAATVHGILDRASEDPPPGLFGRGAAVAGLLLGATGAFLQLQAVLNEIWGATHREKRMKFLTVVLKRLVSFALICGMGVLLVLAVGVSAGLTVAGAYLERSGLGALSLPALRALDFAASFAALGFVFATIYRFLPDCAIRWRDVLPGAGLVAAVVAIAKHPLGVYLDRADMGSAYGQAGSLVVFVFTVYVGCLVFLLGAIVAHAQTRCRATRS